MYSTSSLQTRKVNSDGSFNVFCVSCNEFIATTFQRIGRAQCEMCRRVEQGEELTEEIIREYRLSKIKRVDVSLLLVPDEPKAIGGKKFNIRSLGGDLLQAIGLTKEKTVEVSRKIAIQKRRPRLFNNITVGEEKSIGLGEMRDLDERLRKGDE